MTSPLAGVPKREMKIFMIANVTCDAVSANPIEINIFVSSHIIYKLDWEYPILFVTGVYTISALIQNVVGTFCMFALCSLRLTLKHLLQNVV